MADVHRFYKCGCATDDDQFCKFGDYWVWEERGAMNEWGGLDAAPEREKELIARMDLARLQMRIHLGWQEIAGLYEDVDFDAPEMQPPDDGYDEDPRVVGYPS